MAADPSPFQKRGPTGELHLGSDFSDLDFPFYFLHEGELCREVGAPFIDCRFHKGELKGQKFLLTLLESLLKGGITLDAFMYLKKSLEAREKVERVPDAQTDYYLKSQAKGEFGSNNCLLKTMEEKYY
jgi:hypothetical protein